MADLEKPQISLSLTDLSLGAKDTRTVRMGLPSETNG